ncbi:MAG: hypothetical protein M3Q49_14255 [Actinomycetota bacterium]|nr:hypothetical protein [Actinomycetota bacterium]
MAVLRGLLEDHVLVVEHAGSIWRCRVQDATLRRMDRELEALRKARLHVSDIVRLAKWQGSTCGRAGSRTPRRACA